MADRPINNITVTAYAMIKEAKIETARDLLSRCLRMADTNQYRDRASLSIASNPIWDDVREWLAANPQAPMFAPTVTAGK